MDLVLLIGGLGHIVGAFLFSGIALWALLRPSGGIRRRALAGASLVTVLWSSAVVATSNASILAQGMEGLRDLAWLGMMLTLLLGGPRESWNRSIIALYAVLGAVTLADMGLALIAPYVSDNARVIIAIAFVINVLRMTVAVGALVLVHNLYTAAAPEARWGIKLPMIALAIMWVYDLNLYTIAYLTDHPSDLLYAARGMLMIPIAGLIALGSHRSALWKMRVSRSVTFQTLSLMAIGSYLVLMVLVVRALTLAGIANVELVQLTAIVALSALGAALLPSTRLRAWMRVTLVKHFFQHRYDYRAEWLRFTETLGRPGPDAAPLDERVIKAIADIAESPGGALLVPDGENGLIAGARWSWPQLEIPARAADAAFASHCEQQGRIVEFEALRRGRETLKGETEIVPRWMLDNPRVWATVPLIHFDRLVGLVLLDRPPIDRMLDWEDFDLLRLAGRQVASYLAEAKGQEALSDARRFDEFNRRFAFIVHDIKNLVSQLTLVARNAERHADNPEFRADMVATLKSSVDKMNDLLARLSQHNRGRSEEPRTVSLRSIVDAVAKPRRNAHPLHIEGSADLLASADPARLEQALAHLVQNAIEASPRDVPVTIAIEQRGREMVVSVIDRGTGMPGAFIRDGLFRPFASTKQGGFGIGAYEARALIVAMGGRLEVTSREGFGSRFDIILPEARQDNQARPRKRKAS